MLGVGFDPGVVNAYARYAIDNCFDSVDSIDIIDVNAGSHGRYFATNFDPEINFREFISHGLVLAEQRLEGNKMFEHRKDWDLPVTGRSTTYLTGHDEVHSLSQTLDVPDIRFWMGFSEHYINVFTVLKNLGLLSEQPVRTARGLEVVPLKVVKAVLPDPASLAPGYTGKTCIGDLVKGIKDGQPQRSPHLQRLRPRGMLRRSRQPGHLLHRRRAACRSGPADRQRHLGLRAMANVEELDPSPFIALMNRMGLVTRIRDAQGDRIVNPAQEVVRKRELGMLANAR